MCGLTSHGPVEAGQGQGREWLAGSCGQGASRTTWVRRCRPPPSDKQPGPRPPPKLLSSSRPAAEGHSLGPGGTALLPFPTGKGGGPEASAGGWGVGWAWCWCLRPLPEPQARRDAATTHTHIQTPRDTPTEPGCLGVPRGPTITEAHTDTPHRPAHTQHNIQAHTLQGHTCPEEGIRAGPGRRGGPGSPRPLPPQARPRPAPTGQRPCSWLAAVS